MLSLEPDSFEAYYNLGVNASQRGRYDEAVENYEKAPALDPKHALYAAALNNLGTVQLDRGDKKEAIARWEQALKASPAQLEARYNLASQYLDQGRLDDAIPLHAANGRPEEARKLLDEALRLGGDPARAEAAGYPALAPLLTAAR